MLSEKKIKINEVIFLGLLMMFSANVSNRYFYFIYIAAVFYILVAPCNICINRSMAALSLFAASLIVFDPQYLYSVLGIMKPIAFPLAYVLGYNYVKNEQQDKDKQVIKLIIVMAVGMFIHLFLNYRLNTGSDNRTIVDVWTNETSSATLQASVALWPLALCVSVLFLNVKIVYKGISIAGLVIILLYNMILAGRTMLVIVAGLVVVSMIFMLLNNTGRKNVKNIIFLTVLILIVAYMFTTNTFGVQKAVMNSNFYERFFGDNSNAEIYEDGRMDNKALYLKYMINYPLGGNQLREHLDGAYAHDLYLDVYSEAGVFAFGSIIVYILMSIINLFKIIKDKEFSFSLRQILMCIYLVSNIMFFMEPITAGMPWFLVSYCATDGMVSAMLKNSKKVKGEI